MTPERNQKILDVLSKRQPDITLVFENVHDPHNISAVMRTCDAVGVQEIYILNTAISTSKRYGMKSSASAARWLTIHHFENTEACFNTVKNKYANIFATHLGEQSVSLYDLDLSTSIALVFGNEHAGVTEEALRYCDGNFIIPQVGMVQSLNISVACAVSLYEAFRQRNSKGYYDKIRLETEQYNELKAAWGLTFGEEGREV
ncbi:MAG TPA: RNA methyltransferase [Flavipsychrobacter sp.]|nr:RNA methyltransferase [Flavipsychrobacter sp.]